MIAKQDLSNKVYTIAKKMVSLQEKNQEESNNFIKLSSKLNDLLAQCFEKNLDHEIEKAIQIAVSEKEIDVVNTLLNEVNVEIETLAFNDSEDNECESLMLLLPCIVIGKDMSKPFYSIQELEKEIPFYNIRHSVKSGLTGWAQVKYPYGASVEDAHQKLQYDLYYIKHQTLAFDLIILFKTVKIVIFGRGR